MSSHESHLASNPLSGKYAKLRYLKKAESHNCTDEECVMTGVHKLKQDALLKTHSSGLTQVCRASYITVQVKISNQMEFSVSCL